MKQLKYISMIVAFTALVNSCKKDDMTYTPATMPSQENNRMVMELNKMMSRMDSSDTSGDPDAHFAKMMKIHHQGAIDMSKIITSEGKDAFIKSMAEKIISQSTKEISRLDSFLLNYKPQDEMISFNKKVEAVMMKMHKNAYLQYLNGNLDHDFAVTMIYHHQSAIEMAGLVMLYGHEKVIYDLAAGIQESQEKEISDLQDWLLK
jgi:uncharacterized protein (DUF305 family)